MEMDSNICNSSSSIEAGNNLISETSLSGHEDSNHVGTNEPEENCTVNKNVTDYVNGLNEDESQSCENLNNGNSGPNENEMSNETEMEVNQSESCSSGHNDPLGSENCSIDNVEGGDESKSSESKKNSDKTSEEKSNESENECSVSGIDQCEDISVLSETQSNKTNSIVCESDSNKTDSIVCESESNKTGNSESEVVVLEDSEMKVDEVANTISDSNEKSPRSEKEKENSLNKHDSSQHDLNTDQNSNDSGRVTNLGSTTEKEISNEPNEQVNGDLDDDDDEDQESIPKIHLVTSLDVFLDEQANTASPAGTSNSPVNPLETDYEDTNDNEDSTNAEQDNGSKNIDCIDVTDDTNDNTGTISDSESRKDSSPKVYNKDKVKNAKDPGEQEEVITGDKTLSHEFVTKNLELMGDGSFALNDHGYSKPGTPPAEGKETTKVRKSPKTLKVLLINIK